MDMVRKRKMVSFTLDPLVIERLEAWLAAQEFPPNKSQVIDAALREWLDRRERGDD
jgi:Arc/MetJ-type ribon-helix-helix transcriptional regulator